LIVVIQCAPTKRNDAGHLLSASGKPVVFVAEPKLAPVNHRFEYARPDDLANEHRSWREVLSQYNREQPDNPLGLSPACQLYKHRVYQRLFEQLRRESVYILSAGWGLIRSDFLTPYYDITFSASADRYKRRRRDSRYEDFTMLPDKPAEEVVFFGGADYLALFLSTTDGVRARKTIYYNSTQAPMAAGCVVERFQTPARTNWHYLCAESFLDRELHLR
jgi:hypothetical protein